MKANIVALFCIFGFAGLTFGAEADLGKLPPAADKKDVTFDRDIKPIFEQSCVKCHGEEKPKGKLRLDSRDTALKGGIAGKVIEPGNSAKSPLLFGVAYLGDEDLWMPPPNNKEKIKQLTPEQVGLIRAWIEQGAK